MRLALSAIGVLVCLLAACGQTGLDMPSDNDVSDSLASFEPMIAGCSSCHAPGGQAMTDLDGLSREALVQKLSRYASETTGQTVMHRLARGFEQTDVERIADALSSDAVEGAP